MIVALVLSGCAKPDSVVKPVHSRDDVDKPFATYKGKATPVSGAEISKYAGQIRSAIESHFYDVDSYAGMSCTLRISLAADGMLLDVRTEGGDPALCRAAMKAATQARFPVPPTQAVYQVFKNAVLEFRPGASE